MLAEGSGGGGDTWGAEVDGWEDPGVDSPAACAVVGADAVGSEGCLSSAAANVGLMVYDGAA